MLTLYPVSGGVLLGFPEERADDTSLLPQDDGSRDFFTWGKYLERVESFAKSLIAIGVEAHNTINIIGANSVGDIWISESF
jgi:long-subunit acyl-CoA synthetase (AMP-forming)